MPIWRSIKNSAPSGDPQIHVKYTGLSISKDRQTQATEAVTRARYMVTFVVGQLASLQTANGSAAVKTHAKYYLKRGDSLTQSDLDTIKSVLVLIQTGLGTDTNIKIVSTGDSAGYVNAYRTPKKARWTPGTRTRYQDGTPHANPGAVLRGDIHIKKTQLDRGVNLAAKTIIHEASHKFASTSDFGDRGAVWSNDVDFIDDGLQPDEALNNAESYARLVLHVFEDECGWQ